MAPIATQGKGYVAGDDQEWAYFGYPGHPAPPLGKKVQLLTLGKVSVTGMWKNDGSVIAWAPLIKRNKQIETFLGV